MYVGIVNIPYAYTTLDIGARKSAGFILARCQCADQASVHGVVMHPVLANRAILADFPEPYCTLLLTAREMAAASAGPSAGTTLAISGGENT